MKENFNNAFEGLTVLVTGHTGFKGSWLTLWLLELGANVIGYSLDPPTECNLFNLYNLKDSITHIHADIRDYKKLSETISEHRPDVIFHLAAQPLVLESYISPKETFDINVGGTVNLLEATRHHPFVKAVVTITTDKVYDNKEWLWGYRETDTLGGKDPYSASKAMAEMAVASYRNSFFKGSLSTTAIASARAGNVIGGGDFADNRLVPDAIRALIDDKPIKVRNPNSIRPWLHVLDALSGYLLLAANMLEDKELYSEAWNFGPVANEAITCKQLIEKTIDCWGSGSWVDTSNPNASKESQLLRINWEKAATKLNWSPTYNWEEALQDTIHWYKAFQQPDFNMRKIGIFHIHAHTELHSLVSMS
jgi:CDP-glucose 4,6-dehydratase